MPSLVEMGPVALEKKMNMWKVYDKDDENDKGQRINFDQKKLTWAFGSDELKSR